MREKKTDLGYALDFVKYLCESAEDPIPRYIIKKEILRTTPDESDWKTVQNSKWYLQLFMEQWENGSWGRFHTQDTKSKTKQIFPTTEAALCRALDLSLDYNDERLKKTICLMERFLLDEETWLDKNEHHDNFQEAFKTIITANLSLFSPFHPLVLRKKEACVQVLSKACEDGCFDEAIWEKEDRKSGNILLRPYMVYVPWLLQNNPFLNKKLESLYLQYIWHREKGIYYRLETPVCRPYSIKSPAFPKWMSCLESLSGFSLFGEWMEETINPFLLQQMDLLRKRAVRLPPVQTVIGRYNESWRRKNKREDDYMLRIVRLLAKSEQII